MPFPSSVHVHTTFCDGRATPEEMVRAAIAEGLSVIGFSGHSYVPYNGFGIRPDRLSAYIAEIHRLRDAYAGQIDVLCGIEIDADAPETDLSMFDYTIGSAHSVRDARGRVWVVDSSPEKLERAVREGFGGDALACVSAYYAQFVRYVLALRPTIVGHFDLITKFCEKQPLFDMDGEGYRRVASAALAEVLRAGLVMEVNTGAISRGWRTTPYPAEFLLRQIAEAGGRITLTADAHQADALCGGYEEALALMRRMGFASALTLTRNGFKTVEL